MPEKQFADWQKEPRPSLANAFPEETKTEDGDAVPITPPESTGEQAIEIDGPTDPAATLHGSQPTTIPTNTQLSQPYEKIPMGPDVYRKSSINIPTAEQSTSVYPVPKPDTDLTMSADNWFKQPKEIMTSEQIITPEQKKERLLQKALGQINRAKKAIEKALTSDDSDPQIKRDFYNQLNGSDQQGGSSPSF